MRRIRRSILNGLTVLSLLLFVASLTLWAASYFKRFAASGSFDRAARHEIHNFTIELAGGRIEARNTITHPDPKYFRNSFRNRWSLKIQPWIHAIDDRTNSLGFASAIHRQKGSQGPTSPLGIIYWAIIPIWSITLASTILPLSRLIARRRRFAPGICQS